MKFSLIAAVVVLALAQGSFAQKAFNLEKLGQYFEEVKNKMTEIIHNQDLANQAQTFLEDRKTEMEPLASQIQDQLRTAATNIEEQIKPLAAQMQPMFDNLQKQMEALIQNMAEQARAIGN